MLNFYRISLFFVLIILITSGNIHAKDNLYVKNGVLDLRNGRLYREEIFDLNGEWEFYWKRLLTPADFHNNSTPKKTFNISVPSVWNNYESDGKKLPRNGYATYRIRVLIDKPERLALKLGSIGTAFKVYVDDKVIIKGGVVSDNAETAQPGYKTGVAVFVPDSSVFDLVFQVSNYHYSKGGLWAANHKIGMEEPIRKLRINLINIILFFMGGILLIALYHIGIFILNRKNLSALYFALFSLTYFLRTLLVGEEYIFTLFPNFNWFLFVRIEYLTIIGGLLFAIFFFRSIFSKNLPKKIFNILCVLTISAILIISVSPIWFFTKLLYVFLGYTMLCSIYMFGAIIKEAIQKNPSAVIFAFGSAIFLLTIINDTLFITRIINTNYLSSFGFMCFIFSQAFMLSHRFGLMFKQTDKIALELKWINTDLEKIVEKRTSQIIHQNKELKTAYDEIESKNIELEQQNEEVRASRERIEEQHRTVSRQKEAITSSIHYASRIQQALLPNKEIFKIFPEYFIYYKPRDIVSGDFYWIEKIEHTVFVAVADCTGHGVPGAFMSMLGIAFLNETIARGTYYNTGEILNKLRYRVKKSLKQKSDIWEQKDGMDISLCMINLQTLELQYSGAYHSLYIFRNGEYMKIAGDKQPIAIYCREEPFTFQNIKLEKGDVLYTYTDGIIDQIGGAEKKKFKNKNLMALLLEIYQKPLDEQKEAIENAIQNWMGGNSQIDDMLITGIQI